MIDFDINGIVLRVKNKALGELADTAVCGKTLCDWVGGALPVPYKTIEGAKAVNACEKLRAAVDRARPVTVVLYCDTPLVSARSVSAAVDQLVSGGHDVVRFPRGYVFRTEYLFETDQIFLDCDSVSDGEFMTVSGVEALSAVTKIIHRRILRYHAQNGVIIKDFDNTHIDCDVVIYRNVVIEPYNFIHGKTVIKEGAHILPGNRIENCIIGENTRIDSSRLYNSSVGSGTRVGPFAFIRPDSVIGRDCRIGDFVELKNCIIGDGCKVSHLTYIGDAQLGKECNVGCGVVFANYDGKNKFRSVVGERVFIGSNANIVAPVTIADRAFIAAGSTITKAVPAQALAVARARQTHIDNWTGNVYAPPIDVKPVEPHNVVQYGDGIIDGSASSDSDN